MRSFLILLFGAGMLVGCAGGGGGEPEVAVEQVSIADQARLEIAVPEPLAVPEPRPVSSDTDWEAKAHNKNIEVVQVINVINPVAAYITAGFEKYGTKFSPTLQEEWADTQEQLTKALTLYDDCQARMEGGQYDKQLFLDLEEVWQLLVKTGVAGIRTKSMVDSELQRLVG